jgi:hypothetical protein
MKRKDILYSLNVQDVQEVARREYHRDLTQEEVKFVGAKLGDYIDWYGAVDMAIAQTVRKQNTPS